jgi:hypothetical protein
MMGRVQDKYIAVVKGCFKANSSMHKALKDACECFCNKSVANTSTAELLANYCDMLLRKGEKQSEEELETILEKAVKLLAFINDRDMFGFAAVPTALPPLLCNSLGMPSEPSGWPGAWSTIVLTFCCHSICTV